MTVNLQDTPSAGPIRAIDLERDVNTGRIYHLHRPAWPCEWESCTGRACTDNARECHQAAPEGGKHAEPVSSGTARRDVIGARVGVVVLLTSAATVVGVVSFAVLARWPMAWPLG